MGRPDALSIAMFAGAFPEVSETFIIHQITGLLDLGHSVDIYAEARPEAETPLHSEVEKYRLLDRTTYMDMPLEASPYEMPVLPITDRTWPPGSATPIPNVVRIARAAPAFFESFLRTPALTFRVLRASEYQYQAASLSALYRLAKLSGVSKRYDVVHGHFGPVANSFRFVRQLWKTPLLVSFHGYDLCTVPRNEGKTVYEKLFSVADGITAHSDYATNRLKNLGCPEDRIFRLHVGVNVEQFTFRARTAPAEGPVRIVTVARLVEIKGLEYAIRAVAILRKEQPNILYEIIGDGPERDKLGALIDELGLQKEVVLLGSRAGEAVRAILDQAHLFVLPSINLSGDEEGTPVSLMEAQACGIPVLATRTGGIAEVVRDGESGYLVPDRDPGALAGRLKLLIHQPERWAPMGSRGRAHIEHNYDLRKLSLRLTEIYHETLMKWKERVKD